MAEASDPYSEDSRSMFSRSSPQASAASSPIQ